MGLEGVPVVEQKHDYDGRDGEDEYDEEVAQFGGLLPADGLATAVPRIPAATYAAATDRFTHFN